VPTDSILQVYSETEFEKKDSETYMPKASKSTYQVYQINHPIVQTAPVIFASPHSGRDYSPEFIASSRLNKLKLRRSEDAFLDEVFKNAPDKGAPILYAKFPRSYVDANREPYELDPTMFCETLPNYANKSSPRITAGLGTIAKIVAEGEEIYHKLLKVDDALKRIEIFYRPYHKALQGLLNKTTAQFGSCLLVDCHSMPSSAAPPSKRSGKQVDIVLGDCFSTSCSSEVTEIAQQALQSAGLSVIRNKPYAGGFTTRNYGHPKNSIHVLQIEINRGLYMDEKRILRGPGMKVLTQNMTKLICALTKIDPKILYAKEN
jgi:N-formylglutamate amidohydrolase